MKRVVVTGMAGVTAFGQDWPSVRAKLQAGRNAVVSMPEWAIYDGLNTRLAAPIPDFALPAHYPRKKTRAMGRVSALATVATELALAQAGLCSADPLCAEHHPWRDGVTLHGAACHSCLFAPETSCERGNRYLDRALLVTTLNPPNIAFFRTGG